jgi:peptidoglycan/LPS O-acetylase OafA/YrhL
LVACTVTSCWARAAEHALFAPLRWLGRNSYEVYLSHLFLIIPATRGWKHVGSAPATPLFYLCIVLGSGALGALLANAYSRPLSQRLRARDARLELGAERAEG